jgi:26S proteasome regulatory subunit N3
MEVDQPQTTTEKAPETSTASTTTTSPAASAKKYSPPVDAATGDLVIEGVIYLRLLLILLNLDAGKVEQVRA